MGGSTAQIHFKELLTSFKTDEAWIEVQWSMSMQLPAMYG